jgi:hypothetical protein
LTVSLADNSLTFSGTGRQKFPMVLDGSAAYPSGTSGVVLGKLAILPTAVEPPPSPSQAKTALPLCEQHGLTLYDAVYLELTRHKELSPAPWTLRCSKRHRRKCCANSAAAMSTEPDSIASASLPPCAFLPFTCRPASAACFRLSFRASDHERGRRSGRSFTPFLVFKPHCCLLVFLLLSLESLFLLCPFATAGNEVGWKRKIVFYGINQQPSGIFDSSLFPADPLLSAKQSIRFDR